MKIDVKRVGKLANLPLTPSDEEKYSDQLSKILDYVDQLGQVDTSGVEPIYNVSGLSNVMREDEETKSLFQEESTKNGSNVKDGFFVTKGVFEE
jgi:aspartyl-tRNA(Asn)/glutamyl-tRNA(Gln) amidotransferase subunit C